MEAATNSPKYPTPPDPTTTAAAQTNSNILTGEANQLINQTNQVTPNGTLTYDQSGSTTITDPTTGQTYTVPQYTATTTLSPDQQALLDQQNQFSKLSNQIGLDQTQKIGDLLSQPLNLDDATAQDQILSAYKPMLDQQFAQQNSALQSDLANKGIKEGSAAYTQAMNDQATQQQNALNSMYLTARQNGVNEALTQREEPINEITALMSGGQVTNPSFTNTPSSTINGTDTAGIIENNYNQQVAQANAKAQSQNAMMGGLFGLAAAPLMGWAMSDPTTKKDIKKVGKVKGGLGLYTFKYKGDPGGLQRLGMMATEVEKKVPDAVAKGPNDKKMVNYTRVAEALSR